MALLNLYPDPGLRAVIALAIDSYIGDPPAFLRWIPHPVRVIGWAVEALEQRWNRNPTSSMLFPQAFFVGSGVVLTVAGGAFAIGFVLDAVLEIIPFGWMLTVFIASTLISCRSLDDHVAAVEKCLAPFQEPESEKTASGEFEEDDDAHDDEGWGIDASYGPVSGGPVSGGPVSGGPVSGGPVSGGPVSDGPVSDGPDRGVNHELDHEPEAALSPEQRESLNRAQKAVGHIVGRDPHSLDAAGVARAAIESLAENFSDGVVAPLFYYGLLGLPGLLAYKAINTMDSMIGHHTPRYEAFGKMAARVDDLVNYLPARLAGILIVLSARLLPQSLPGWKNAGDVGAAWRAFRRDAGKHRSMNAGWVEAPMAGALGLRLGGPRHYPEETVDEPWLGEGRAEAGAADIGRARLLYRVASLLLAVSLLMLF